MVFFNMEQITHSTKQTQQLAAQFAHTLKKGDVIAFLGGMGAGKTAFVRGLAHGLDLVGEVSSPTFSIVNEYFGSCNLVHFDMYRVQNIDDLETTGFYDYLDSQNCILAVEWSENIQDELPKDTYFVQIDILDCDTRHIKIFGGPNDYTGN